MAGTVGMIGRAWAKAFRGIFDAVASTVIGFTGTYQALDPRRQIIPHNQRYTSQSANELATMTLAQLRVLCRKLERDNPTARAAVEGMVAQIVGTGIALEPDHGDETVNQRLRAVWQEYIRTCDVTGKRSIFDLQMQAFREVFIAGEFLWRLPVLPDRADRGLVPLVIMPLECEWIAADLPRTTANGITQVAGINLDRYGRPVSYILRNPETAYAADTETVGEAEVIHEFERRRSLQARGEPWMAPVIERIWQEGDLVDAELRSAVNCAAMAIVVTSQNHGPLDTTTNGTATDPAQSIAIGGVARVYPGEDVKAFSHNRPSQQIGAFRQSLRGDISSACRLAQTWLDRDYSRANYSSMRAAMLDNERLLAPVREWFGHASIGALYLRVLPYLCVLAGVKIPKRLAYRLLPDGQPYVDPQKDIQAASMAVAAGFSTHEAEIAKRGGDYREVWKQLASERAEAAALGLVLDLGWSPTPATVAAADTATDANGDPLPVATNASTNAP